MAQNTLNPLEFSSLKHHAVPFDKITPELFVPQLKTAIAAAKAEIEKIKTQTAAADFTNTILALETAGETVDLTSGVFFNTLSANTNEKLQALAGEVSTLLANYGSDIQLDSQLFQRIQTVYENRQRFALQPEELQLLEKLYSDFVRNGARLDDEKKAELRTINAELSKLGPQFSENVLKATNEFQLHLQTPEEIKGLPESVLASAEQAAKAKGLTTGWLFTLHAPSYVPFMQFSENRTAREKMYRAFNSRAGAGAFDNRQNILSILKLREQRAKLLGYENHAAFTLEKRMAESPQKVWAFLERLQKASVDAAKREVQQIEDYARQQGAPTPIMPWDFSYWAERLKEKLFQFNAEDLRPYFQLEKVIAGVFEHAKRLYGITFKESTEYPVYHPDVKTYEVYNASNNEYVGLFYADFFPRESKNGGAWMTNYYEQGLFNGQVHRPHVAIVCNFTQPTPDRPSLLTFDEVRTIFHEFGHALHSLMSNCKFRTLSGTNVYWDFVELPSQIMENWTYEKESLDLFAEHYKTGEKIPAELAKKIKDSSHYMAGYMCLRQVTFAWLDMAWHTHAADTIPDVEQFEDSITEKMRVLPKISGINFSCAFTHVFSGGYSAGYYSYKWAEVLDADAFEAFLDNGLFDKKTAESFKNNILSRGGTEHPMTLYKKFRGREPDPDALLRRDGLI